MKLRPQAGADKALKDHLECVHIFDEETGELWEPKVPPPDLTPDDDEDEPGPGEGHEHDPGGLRR